MNDAQIVAVIQQGKDRMPGFPDLKGEEFKDLMNYLRSSSESAAKPAAGNSSSKTHRTGPSRLVVRCSSRAAPFAMDATQWEARPAPTLRNRRLCMPM